MLALRQCSPKLLVATAQRSRWNGGRQRRQKGQKKMHYSLEPAATEVEIEVVSGREYLL